MCDREGWGKAPVEILEKEKSIFCFQFRASNIEFSPDFGQKNKKETKKKVSVMLTVFFR